jgi:hypothetical protein
VTRQFTSPPSSAGAQVALPVQANAGHVIAVRFSYTSDAAATSTVVPAMRWDFAGVTQVVGVPMTQPLPIGWTYLMATFAVDVTTSVVTLSAGNILITQRIPRIPLSSQMKVSLEFFDSDALDVCNEVSWLIDDEG